MQVVWYAAERKKEKKKVGKQLPVTYMSSSQFSQHFLSVAPKYNHMYGKKKKKYHTFQPGFIPLTNQSSLLNFKW